jgi:sulfoxide reductase heme-binding subunit YedZ
MHLTSSPLDWELARASGIVAYVLLSLVVFVGVALAGKVRSTRWPRFAVEDVHRFGGILVGVFVWLHVVTIAIDGYLPFSLRQLVVPGAASFRPFWTALGIVAAELLLALAVTNKLKARLPYGVWRRAHYLNLPLWLLATGHSIAGGTDGQSVWLLGLYAAASVAVLGALAWRIGGRAPAVAAAALAGACIAVGVAFLPHGSGGTATAAAAAVTPARVTDSFSGRIAQEDGVVSLTGSGASTSFRLDLVLDRGGNVEQSRLEVDANGSTCTGSVSSADRNGAAGTCSLPDGTTRNVSIDWQLGESSLAGRLTLAG